MAYVAGTMGATATPAKDLIVNIIHPFITANGFTYIEEWTSGADTTRIYKSAQTDNGTLDWYLYLRRITDAATVVYTYVSEAWDATNKKVQKYVPTTSLNGGVPISASGYVIADTVGVAPTAPCQIPNGSTQFALLTNPAGHQYWMSANSSRLIVGARITTSDSGVYLGLADNLIPLSVPGSGPFLIECPLAPTSFGNQYGPCSHGFGGYGGATREPNQTISVAGNYSIGIYTSTPLGLSPQALDTAYTNKGYASKVGIFSNRPTASPPSGLRGSPKDVVYAQYANTAVNGDTITLDGKIYVCLGYTGSRLFTDTTA